MKPVKSYLWKYRWSYLLIFVCMLAAIALDMLSPQITKIIVNDVFVGGNLERLPLLLVGIVAIGVGRSIFGYWKEFTADKTGAMIGREMRDELFSHIQGLSMDFFGRTNTGELMARVKEDIDHIWSVLGFIGMFAIEIVIHVGSVLYCMFRLNWKLTFLPLIFMTICGFVAVLLEKKLDVVYEDISEENAELTTIAEENLAGVRTVKAFAREKFEIQKFLSHNQRYYDLNMREAKTIMKYDPVFSFIGLALPIVCTVLGGVLVIREEMDIGSLVAYVEYTRNCTWPMETIGWLINSVSFAIASRKKVVRILEEQSSVKEPEKPIKLDKIKGNLEFSHVTYRIDNREILKDVSFILTEGKTLGIMGATGSGKSTIVNLIQRFDDSDSGEILLEGVNLKELSLAQIRSGSSVVMQDVFLFSDTIRENIEMGQRGRLTSEEIREAASLAQAKDFIEEMEGSYDTIIGERGVGLSGGQKQRISIARALAKRNPLLILDDSTSALDMETEHEIQKTLKELTETTKIIIAHRISAVRHADEILYLEDGSIAERGTHKELMAKKGLYYETYLAQYGACPEEVNKSWQ